MSQSIKANRKGRNLVNYSGSGLGWSGTTRRNTFIGKDCIQNRMNSESYMRHSNYDGRPPPEVKKCTTLSRAIAVEEKRRSADPPPFRTRPGYLGDAVDQQPEERGSVLAPAPVTPENQPKASVRTPEGCRASAGDAKAGDAKAYGRLTWIDTRTQQAQQQQQQPQPQPQQVQQQTPPQQRRGTKEPQRASQEQQRPSQDTQRASQRVLRAPQETQRLSQEASRGSQEGRRPSQLAAPRASQAVVEAHRGSQQQQQQPSPPPPEQPEKPEKPQQQPLLQRPQQKVEQIAQSPEIDRRHTLPVKLASNGSQSQPVLSPAVTRRVTSPTSVPERPASPRVPPGSDTGNSFMRFSSASTRSPRPGSSVYSDNLDTSRMSQALSASGGSQLGGTGERLNPRKWSTMVAVAPDRTKRRTVPVPSGHDGYVVEHLRRRRDEADGAEREELDRQLVALLHERRSGSPLISPRPMSTAFTDRALRKREGMGSRAAMVPEEGGHSAAAVQEDCGCAVCQPQLVNPAGNPSHSIHSNLQHYIHRNEVIPLSPQTARPKSEYQGKRSPGSPNYDSGRVDRLIKAVPRGPVQSLEELHQDFTAEMGKKGKGRSLSADPTTAGRYRRKAEMDLETDPHFRVRAMGCVDPSTRSEVAMVLSPCMTDPPRPTAITSCKKAHGEHKFSISQHAEKVSVHWNQPLYRYECAAVRDLEGPSRSASLPSSHFAVTFPPTGERSPRRGDDSGRAGDFSPPGFGGGRRSPRPPEGCEVALATNHDLLAEEAARARSERMVTDQRFSDLCLFTQEASQGQVKELNELKEKYTTRQAQRMASVLAWQE